MKDTEVYDKTLIPGGTNFQVATPTPTLPHIYLPIQAQRVLLPPLLSHVQATLHLEFYDRYRI